MSSTSILSANTDIPLSDWDWEYCIQCGNQYTLETTEWDYDINSAWFEVCCSSCYMRTVFNFNIEPKITVEEPTLEDILMEVWMPR